MEITNEKYDVSGMTCASCSAHVTKAVQGVKGVKEVNVNLLTNSMLVTYDAPATPSSICAAVDKAGYGAKLSPVNADNNNKGTKDTLSLEKEELEDHTTPKLLRRLIISLVLLIPLFYLSMGYMNMSWNWPLGALRDNPFYFGLTEMLLSAVIMIINKDFFISGFKSAIHGAPNMDTLVALGSGVAFIYGVVVMFMMSSLLGPEMGTSGWDNLMKMSMGLTFETAGMVPTLITIGKTLESYSKGKTTSAIKSLMDLAPKTAHVIRDGKEVTVAADEVQKDEIFVVRPGESFPVDGVVLEGDSSVNEAALTGESMPVDKTKGSKVSAATINQNGSLTCKATKVGNDTALHQIIEMVQTAAGTKTKISQLADKVSGVFVPTIIAIAIIVLVSWLVFGRGYVNAMHDDTVTLFSYALERAISVLVVACPCALGLATPVAIMVGSGKGAKNGILFKTASALEETGKMDFVVLDKTGTLTKGTPVVTDIYPAHKINKEDLLRIAASLEAKSEHPLAKAIREEAKKENLEFASALDFKALPGHGVKGSIDGKEAYAGNAALMEENGVLTSEMRNEGDELASQGKTPLYFVYDKKLIGIIAVADVLKDDSKEAIAELKAMGITPIMLTGDNARTAKAIAEQAGLDYYVSDVLPDGKQKVIKDLQQYGKVAMVGDGINDAPALTQADIGIAIGAGTDVAIDSADVVLMKSNLTDAAAAIRLSRHTLTNIKENLFWAFFYNIIMIPIAAGALSGVGVAKLKPWYGAAAMALSSVTVCLNALRINLFNVYNVKKDRHHKKVDLPSDFMNKELNCPLPQIKAEPEDGYVLKEVKVNGMMCDNCVKHVTKALKSVKGVRRAEVSLAKKNAIVEMKEDVKDADLIKAVTDAGYEVESVKPYKEEAVTENQVQKEEHIMKKVAAVEGMMCDHCVMHVTKALEGVKGVKSAKVSLKDKSAVIECDESVKDDDLKKAVEEAGYSITSIK